MSDTTPTDSAGEPAHTEPTPEEVAAFEGDAETIGQYADLMVADLNAQCDTAEAEYEAAVARGASKDELFALRRQNTRNLRPLYYAFLAVLIALIAAYILFYDNGVDTLAGLDDDPLSGEIADIAPPEPAATAAEVLPPEVFEATCEDCGGVTQVALDLNPDAKYQFAYEEGGSRLAIFTVVDASEYQDLVATFEAAQQAGDDAEQVDAPVHLDGIGEEAVIYSGSVIFHTAEDCGVISGMMRQGADGVPYPTLSAGELERLARIAVPRM